MKYFLLFICMLFAAGASAAVGEVRWHNENTDTIRITEVLNETAMHEFANPSVRVGYIARKFIGTPYVAHTLEGEKELLTVNMDELDCTTFVDVALAMAYTVGEHRTSWQDFLFNLQRMRYRNGEIDGYASRLHYNCDWAIDNIHRGNITDVTSNFSKCKYQVRSINFMSGHRDSYAALADSASYARVRDIENGYRNHRFPYIKTVDLASKEINSRLREGDILAFVSKLKDLDVTHMGIVVKENGETRVLHASMTNGKVEITDVTLAEFVKRNRNWIGVRIYRLKE